MSTMSLRLPESLHRKLRELAKREGISINQLATMAVAEKISALMTEEYLAQRASRGSRKKYRRVLSKVPGREPDQGDEVVRRT
jgi:predicted transcriptional regulator